MKNERAQSEKAMSRGSKKNAIIFSMLLISILVLALITVYLLMLHGVDNEKISENVSDIEDTIINTIKITKIADIRANPKMYEDKVVTIEGTYQGWSSGYPGGGVPPVSRSDWLVKDDTGWIYVTGKRPGLDPLADVGTRIVVTGIVRSSEDGEGDAYIVAEKIEEK